MNIIILGSNNGLTSFDTYHTQTFLAVNLIFSGKLIVSCIFSFILLDYLKMILCCQLKMEAQHSLHFLKISTSVMRLLDQPM